MDSEVMQGRDSGSVAAVPSPCARPMQLPMVSAAGAAGAAAVVESASAAVRRRRIDCRREDEEDSRGERGRNGIRAVERDEWRVGSSEGGRQVAGGRPHGVSDSDSG